MTLEIKGSPIMDRYYQIGLKAGREGQIARCPYDHDLVEIATGWNLGHAAGLKEWEAKQ